MRGIEVSTLILKDVRRGLFASESIRRHGKDLSASDRTLLSLLVYSSLRRTELWENIAFRFLRLPIKKLSPDVRDVLVLGTAGILDLRHFSSRVLVNGLVQSLKARGNTGGAKLVNAVLRKISEEGAQILDSLVKNDNIQERALVCGIPYWIVLRWQKYMDSPSLLKLMKLHRMRSYLSLRAFPGDKTDDLIRNLRHDGYRAWPSTLVEDSIRLSGSAYPPALPGFSSGYVTPQSESSMMVGKVVSRLWNGGHIIDMCTGRGIKLGQIAQMLPDVSLEGWEISPSKARAAENEMKRLGIGGNVSIRAGDSLTLKTDRTPGLVLLDAPCSGSGTWNRHPESRWRLSSKILQNSSSLQKKLLHKALSMVAPGGIVIYSTCSLLRDENEDVILNVLKERKNCHYVNIPLQNRHIRQGEPLGIYTWPDLPWLDGFFIAAISKD